MVKQREGSGKKTVSFKPPTLERPEAVLTGGDEGIDALNKQLLEEAERQNRRPLELRPMQQLADRKNYFTSHRK